MLFKNAFTSTYFNIFNSMCGYFGKTRVKPDIPTKSYTCMSTSWLLGNVYTAKSCKGEKRVTDALKSGLVS